MEEVMANTILKELREFREENNKKWEENDKRWEQNERRWEENNKRWEQNDKRWEENDRRWEQNEIRWKDNDKILAEINERLTNVENGREKDRRDILEELNSMKKSITEKFKELKMNYDVQFEKIFSAQRVDDLEHRDFKKLIYAHERRLDFYNLRINRLEQWKEDMDLGKYTTV